MLGANDMETPHPTAQLLLILLLSSSVRHISAQLQLPISRLPFVSPADAALSVRSYQVFRQSGVFSLINSSLTAGRPDAAYCIQLLVGTPEQMLRAILDTGSTDCVVAGFQAPSLNRWFNAELSSSLSWLQQLVRRPYTVGFWEGHLASDVVTVADASGRAVSPQVVAAFIVAERSSDFFDRGGGGVWQGSVGLAFSRLASAQTAASDGASFADALARRVGEAATGAPAAFAMQLCTGDAGSFISIGRRNRTGMLYAAVRYGWYYEVVIADVRLNDFSLGMDCKEFNFELAVVHSGIGDIRLPPRVHARIAQQLGDQMPQLGNQFFNGLSLLCSRGADANATTELLGAFPFITFSLVSSPNETVDLSLSPAQYLRQVTGAAANRSCFRFGLQKSTTGTVLGSSFLSGFLVEFDRQQNRVGFYQSGCSSYQGAPPSGVSRGPPIPPGSGDPWGECAFFRADPDESKGVVRTGAIALAIVCVACVLPVCALLLWRQLRRSRDDEEDGETVQLVQG